MGMYSTISPVSGKLYDFEIEGDNPNPEEFDKIQNFISNDGVLVQGPAEEAVPDEEGGLLTFGKSTVGGLLSSLAQVPGGLSALGEYVGGYDIGSTDFGKAAQNWSNETTESLQETFDMNESVSSKAGQAAGSLLSFFIPGTAVAKGASLLGAGARLAGASALGTMATQGAALQSADQLNRMANFIENGGEIDEDTKRKAVALSGLLGTTEALPFAPMFRTLGTAMRILKKVPKGQRDAALLTIGGRLKRAFGVGLAEGGQEVFAGVVQDMIEKGQYNPDLEVGQSAYDDAVYGGGAGAALNLIIDSVRGRQLNKFYKKEMQLDEDIKDLNRQALKRQENYNNYAESLKPVGLLPPPTEAITTEEQKRLMPPSEKIQKAVTPLAIEDLRTRGQRNAADTIAAARETTQPFTGVSLSNLPKEEALRIAQRRQTLGLDINADVSIDEIEGVIGMAAARREMAKQKPILTQQIGDTVYSPTGREEQLSDQQADEVNKEASAITEDLVVKGKLNKNTLRKALQASFGKTVKITNSDVDTYLKLLEQEGVVTRDKRGRYVKADDRVLDIKAKSEAIKQRGKEILNIQNKAVSEEEIDNLAKEYLALKNEADILERASNKVEAKEAEKVEADNVVPDYTAKRNSDQAAKSPYTEEYKLKLTSVLNNLNKQLQDMGLGSVKLQGESIIKDQKGEIDAGIEGYFTSTPDGKRIIGLAMDLYDPNLTEAQLTKKLSGVLNHEIIHALRNMGAISDADYNILVTAATKRKYVGEKNGKFVTKEYTYMERATALYRNQEGMTEEAVQEEAVAEMFRDYADGKFKIVGKPKSLFDRIIRILKAIFTSNYEAGFTQSNQIFANILSTKAEVEIKKKQKADKQARSSKKYSTAGVAAGYIRPELGNIERIKLSFKDVTDRLDALQKSAKRLSEGKITYEQYDKLVNKVKPIVPYETVPAPATIEEMRFALTDKQAERINALDNVPEGTEVQLRLDINAYTRKGVWVPTIHGSTETVRLGLSKSKDAPISHDSVAIVNNANFLMGESAEAKGLKVAMGAAKSPFATIEGNLEKTTPDAAHAEAVAAMNDPSYIQVGYDPERHSYFYDRMTTQPVATADRVIQVGPLVMARNPVFEEKSNFKYSKISSTPEGFENRLIGFIKDNPDGFTIDPDTFTVPSKGKAVAPVKAAEIITRPELITPSLIRDFARNVQIMTKVAGRASLDNKVYAGGWLNQKDGLFYLDATMVIEDPRDALYTAEAGNQIAIFDLGEFYETNTQEGIRRLKQDRTYSGDRRARIGSNIRQYSQEFIEARREDPSRQRIKYSKITVSRKSVDFGNPVTTISNGITDIHVSKNEIDNYFYRTSSDGLTTLNPDGTVNNSGFPSLPYAFTRKESIEQATEELESEIAREDLRKAIEGEDRKYSRISQNPIELASEKRGPNGKPLIEFTVAKEYTENMIDPFTPVGEGQEASTGVFKVQPEYQTDPNKATIARKNKVRVPFAPVNHAKAKGFDVYAGNVPIFDIFSDDPAIAEKAQEDVAIMMAAEGFAAHNQDQSALGWYDRTLKAAKALLQDPDVGLYKDISKSIDNRLAFDWALSVTSNGIGAVPNFGYAGQIYDAWVNSSEVVEDRRFPIQGWGDSATSMENAFAFYNALKNQGQNSKQIYELMNMKTTPAKLRQDPRIKDLLMDIPEDLAKKRSTVKNPVGTEIPYSVPASELASTEVTGSYVIGAKIGEGFFQNLSGNYDALTMDMWFMRMFNRLIGRPFQQPVDETTLDANYDRVLNNLQGLSTRRGNARTLYEDPLTEFDINEIEYAMKTMGIDNVTRGNVLEFSRVLHKEFQRKFNRAARRKEPRLPKSELQKAAQRLVENNENQLQEDPTSGGERLVIRKVTNRAREILKEGSGGKIDLTMADFQAQQWFAEKRLWFASGVLKGQGDDNDYLDGAIQLLRERGVDNERIAEAITRIAPAERGRLFSVSGSLRPDGQLRQSDDRDSAGEQGTNETDIEIDPFEGLPRSQVAVLEEDALDMKYSILGRPASMDDPKSFVMLPRSQQKRTTTGLGGYDIKAYYKYGNPFTYGMAQSMNGTNNYVVMPRGEHFELTNRKGKYGGYGYEHMFGDRFDNIGVRLPSHAETILKYHDVRNDDPLELVYSMLEEYSNYLRDSRNTNTIKRIKDYGIRVFPDGGVGNNDIRIEWDNAPLKSPEPMQPDANGKFPDGSTMSRDRFGKPWTRKNPRPSSKAPQERTLVMSLKYEPQGFKAVKRVKPKNFAANVKQVFAEKEFEWRPLYQVRTTFSKPQNTAAKQRFQYSTISSNPAQTTSPNSADIIQDIERKTLNLKYDNLSRFIAKGLGVFMAEDVAKARAQRILTYFQDAMLPVGAMMDELRKNGFTITDAMDTYMQEAVYQGIVGDKVTQVQEELFQPMVDTMDTLNISEDKIQELRDIKGAGDSPGFFESIENNYISKKLAMTDAVLYAFHAKQRNDYLRNKSDGAIDSGSGMTDAQADEIIAWYNSLEQSEIAKFDELREFARKINEDTIDRRIEAGLLPADARDPNRQPPIIIYQDGSYVPLQGDSDIEVESMLESTYGRKRVYTNFFGATGREDKRATGRAAVNDYAENIVASLMAQNNNSIDRAERNKVGQSFARLLEGQEEQADGTTAINASLKKEMEKIGLDVTDKTPVQRRDMGIKPDNEFKYKENGQERVIFIKDPRIAKAMNGALTPQQNNFVIRAMGKFNRFLSAVNTTYNPSFVIPNFFRDLETAGINMQEYDEKGMTAEVIKGTPSAVKGIARLLGVPFLDKNAPNEWSDIYKEFVSAGGKNATNQMSDVKDQIDNIGSILGDVADSGIKQKLGLNKNQFAGKNIRSIMSVLDNANTAVENGVRVSLYKALRDRGVSKIQAAQAARNVTVNFAKGGENKAVFNSMYLFYNASLQGSMALVNAAVKSSKVRKMWAGLIVYGIAQDMINGLFAGDEDEDGINDYDELPQHILEHNLIIPTFGLTGDKHVTIPLAYGLNMAVNFGRSISRVARGEYTPGEATRSIVGTTVEAISPIGAYDNFLTFAAPTVMDPFISVGINEDYKGDPIYKESPTYASVSKSNSSQYWSNTSSIAKTIASSVNSLTGGDDIKSGHIDMSPDIIEYWFGTFTGGVGRFTMRTLEAPIDIYDALQGDFEGSLINSIPLARKVITTPSPRADTGNYLENRKDLFTLMAQLDIAKRSGDIGAVKSIYESNKKQLSIVGRMKAIDNARNRMQRQIKEIERNPRIPDETKRKIIRIRRQKINELQQMGLILMRSVGYKKAG